MYYYLYNTNGFYDGMTETEPEHNRWTNIAPSFTNLKEKWNGSIWIEGATNEEINLYNQQQIDILNKEQYDELQPYDWYFTRFTRKGIEVPKEVIDITNEIDEKYKKLKEKFKWVYNG